MKITVSQNIYIFSPIFLFLTACISQNHTDLEVKLDEIMARPPNHIEPIPEVEPYEAYTYQSGQRDVRDPFKLFYEKELVINNDDEIDDGLTEDMRRIISDRNREELESYELDSLAMVGTIKKSGDLWGLIEDPDQGVHRVQVDNYMGRNFGRITEIENDVIKLKEIIQDGQGRWGEREAAIALVEDE